MFKGNMAQTLRHLRHHKKAHFSKNLENFRETIRKIKYGPKSLKSTLKRTLDEKYKLLTIDYYNKRRRLVSNLVDELRKNDTADIKNVINIFTELKRNYEITYKIDTGCNKYCKSMVQPYSGSIELLNILFAICTMYVHAPHLINMQDLILLHDETYLHNTYQPIGELSPILNHIIRSLRTLDEGAR
jgi:hypothetical protein